MYIICSKDLVRLVEIGYMGLHGAFGPFKGKFSFFSNLVRSLLVTCYLPCSISRSLNQESLHQGQRILFMVQISGECNFSTVPIHTLRKVHLDIIARCADLEDIEWSKFVMNFMIQAKGSMRVWTSSQRVYHCYERYSLAPTCSKENSVVLGGWVMWCSFSILLHSSCALSRVTLIYALRLEFS